MAKRGTAITDGADAVLDNHNVYRNGSVWACRFCSRTWPFPSPLPDSAGPCTPRRWGDSAPEMTGGLSADDPLRRACRRCQAAPGERCCDLRRVMGVTLRPHRER